MPGPTQDIVTLAYPDADLAFHRTAMLTIFGNAVRFVERPSATTTTKMPEDIIVTLLTPDGKPAARKTLVTQGVGLKTVTGSFLASFRLGEALSGLTVDDPAAAWTIKVTAKFRERDGSMTVHERTVTIRIAGESDASSAESVGPWFPTPPVDGGFDFEWKRPVTDDLAPRFEFPVLATSRTFLTHHFPVIELLDNVNRCVMTSAIVQGWTRETPWVRTILTAPGSLDTARGTHQLRLTVVDMGRSRRVASSYHPLGDVVRTQSTIIASGSGARTVARSAPTSYPSHAERDSSQSSVRCRVDLNEDSIRRIAGALPGIGLVRAKKIIAARPIKAIEDLNQIEGITPWMIESIRNLVKQ